MPLYDYLCPKGHVTERRAGYDDSAIACDCGAVAERQAVYLEQSTITETGAVAGARDRSRRDHLGEKLNMLRKSSVETYRETGQQSGPIKVRDWDR
jgi:hypothetical protein